MKQIFSILAILLISNVFAQKLEVLHEQNPINKFENIHVQKIAKIHYKVVS